MKGNGEKQLPDSGQPSPARPGRLHLIPVGLGPADPRHWLPPAVQQLAAGIQIYIAENAKTARAFLKQIGTHHVLQSITIHTLGPRTRPGDIRQWLQPLSQGQDIGLVSEAGCPAVADPGSAVVRMAHDLNVQVVPHVGPSSILLGLMASGLDGQRFSFHGYAPVEPSARARQLRTWENLSRKLKQTQILIETPYRNDAMYDTLLQTLHGDTQLCVARALTTADEWILTRRIAQWKSAPRPQLAKMPALFLFLAD